MNGITIDILTGKSDSHIDKKYRIHHEMVGPFLNFQERAKQSGIDLQIASGYRCFSRQLTIWNEKAQGKRVVVDENEVVLMRKDFDDWQWAQKILKYSALPGTSRHHWGTDIDVYDKQALKSGQTLQLMPSEYLQQGCFAKLASWLEQNEDRCGGFFRPYQSEHLLICFEPWHLSYAPLAHQFEQFLTPKILKELITNSPIELKEALLNNLPTLCKLYSIGQ